MRAWSILLRQFHNTSHNHNELSLNRVAGCGGQAGASSSHPYAIISDSEFYGWGASPGDRLGGAQIAAPDPLA